jgi:hypothetical protein
VSVLFHLKESFPGFQPGQDSLTRCGSIKGGKVSLVIEKTELAGENARLADEKEAERDAAVVAQKEAERQEQLAKHATDLAEQRAETIRQNLYRAEMFVGHRSHETERAGRWRRREFQ